MVVRGEDKKKTDGQRKTEKWQANSKSALKFWNGKKILLTIET